MTSPNARDGGNVLRRRIRVLIGTIGACVLVSPVLLVLQAVVVPDVAHAVTSNWWPGDLGISQKFGCGGISAEPIESWRGCGSGVHFHDGVDIAMACGTALNAPVAVYVKSVGGSETGLGPYYPTLVLPNGYQVLLGHVQKTYVHAGQTYPPGTHIADAGTMGHSSGCHLHFEVRPPGTSWGHSVDPMPYLNPQSLLSMLYANHIVQWDGDTKPQKTSWVVIVDNGVLRRRHVQTIDDYWCLRKSMPDAGPLPASLL